MDFIFFLNFLFLVIFTLFMWIIFIVLLLAIFGIAKAKALTQLLMWKLNPGIMTRGIVLNIIGKLNN